MSISNKVNKLVCELVKEAIMECGVKYGFDGAIAVEEMLSSREECVGKVGKVGKKEVVVVSKPSFPLPFSNEMNSDLCFGLQLNSGLYTQCSLMKSRDSSCYCKTHQAQAESSSAGVPSHGTIQQRMAVDALAFVDPSGKSPVAYSKIMKKLNLSEEQVREEAGKWNIKIDERHFEVVAKKGRPKVEKPVKEVKQTKGRPKKAKKVVEVEETDDLFASIVAQAAKEEEIASISEEEMSEKEANSSAKEMSEEKESKKVADKAAKAEEKEAKKAAEKAAKEAAKAEEKEAKKAAEKAAKEAAKAEEKEAKKAADKAAKEAAKEAKKPSKKADKKPDKKSDKKKEEPVPEPKEEEEEEETEEVHVDKFEHNGIKYLKAKGTNILYLNEEAVGIWNEKTKQIDAYEEDEEEEECDSECVEEEYEE
jgi:hypothetical protein